MVIHVEGNEHQLRPLAFIFLPAEPRVLLLEAINTLQPSLNILVKFRSL